MRYELSFVVNHKNEKKGPRLINSVLETVVKENIPALLCEIRVHDLRESLKTALQNLYDYSDLQRCLRFWSV